MIILGYTVNYFDVGIVLLILLAAVFGYRRGLILSVINFIRYSFGMTLCLFGSSRLAPAVYDAYVKPQCVSIINEQIVKSSNIDEVMKNLKHYAATLPEFISRNMNVDKLDISSENIADSILKNVFEPVALVITQIILFIAIFILFFAVTGVIIAVFRNRSKRKDEERGRKTSAKVADQLLGAVLGVLKSAVFIFGIAAVITYILSLDDALAEKSEFFRQAADSTLMHYIDSINPFNVITEGIV